jgi:hypothetical protein
MKFIPSLTQRGFGIIHPLMSHEEGRLISEQEAKDFISKNSKEIELNKEDDFFLEDTEIDGC